MLTRRGGRTTWLPSYLIGPPALIAGLWMALNVDFGVTPGESALLITLNIPGFSDISVGPMFIIGLVLLVVGVIGTFHLWIPLDATTWKMVVRWYPAMVMAGHAFLFAALAATFELSGSLVDIDGGFAWRTTASLRGVADLVLAGIFAFIGLVCYASSLGRGVVQERRFQPTANNTHATA